MRNVCILKHGFPFIEDVPVWALKSGHVISDIEIKNGYIFNGFIVFDKSPEDKYFKMFNCKNSIIKIISDEDEWDIDNIIDLCPNIKQCYNFKVISKGMFADKTEYVLEYYNHNDNYINCDCKKCTSIIEYKDKYCRACGEINTNIIPDDIYDNAIEFIN